MPALDGEMPQEDEMALPLEETIMREIGLGASYSWHNGSGSCGYQAKESAGKLTDLIKNHANAGEQIAQPIHSLIALAGRIADTEPDTYTLTRTWEACSYIIAAHIHEFHSPGEAAKTEEYLRKHYLAHERVNPWNKPDGFFRYKDLLR